MMLPRHRLETIWTLLVGVALASPAAVAPGEPAENVSAGPPRGDAASEAEGDPRADAGADAVAEAEAQAEAARQAMMDRLLLRIGETLRGGQLSPRQIDPEMLLPHYLAQSTRQFRPLLTTELQFIEMLCRPTPEEYQTIKAAGEARLELTARAYADLQVRREQEGFRPGLELDWPNPRELILGALADSVGQTLPADRARLYELELQKRAAARKQATVLYLVKQLEAALLLSSEQRDQLTEIVRSSWEEEWSELLERLPHYRADVLPVALPDDRVLPLLSDAQRWIWSGRRVRERYFGGWSGFGFLQPVVEEEEAEAAEEAQDEDSGAAAEEESP